MSLALARCPSTSPSPCPRGQSPDLSQLINCTGDAYLTRNTLELTRKPRDQDSTYSVGRATYTQPVPLWDAATGETASFVTTFSFRISLHPRKFAGDGMAFFLAHFGVGSGVPTNSSGGMLGLLPAYSNGTGDGTIVAVEFDTFQNLANDDISSSHVGIDVNSLNSTASTDTTSRTRNLTSGYEMVATVTYENVTKFLVVELNINGASYYVNATVDLSSCLPEYVAVGFSAASGVCRHSGEQHQILSWSFASTLEPKQQKHPQRVVLLTYVLAPLLFLLACAALLGLLLWQKHKRRRRSELEIGVAASGPRRYTYRELAAATNNFAEDEKLGRGGFGSVYRGKLAVSGEERPVAIKMLSSESSEQGRKEFEALYLLL